MKIVWLTLFFSFAAIPHFRNHKERKMGLAIVRRMSRYTWLRLLVTLTIYLIAVPGTVRSSAFGGVAAAKVPAQSGPVERELKHERPGRDIIDDEVRVYYCTTCGFQQNFLEVKTYLEERYPHLVDRVYGENYEVDPMKKVRVCDSKRRAICRCNRGCSNR